jgi:hypothetical protein
LALETGAGVAEKDLSEAAGRVRFTGRKIFLTGSNGEKETVFNRRALAKVSQE